MFKLRPFQFEDLTRAATHDGLILAWQQGLGKSIAAVIWSLLKVGVDWPSSRLARGFVPREPVLFVAPENLHDQLCAEWVSRFGMKVIRLDSQDTYLKLTQDRTRKLRPGWYLTSYTQLGLNKVKELIDPKTCKRDFASIAKMLYCYGATVDEVKAFPVEGVTAEDPLIRKAVALCTQRHDLFSEGVGDWGDAGQGQNPNVRCVFSPSLADLCGHEFAAVVIDEGTRIKGETTIIGRAVRQLEPRYRLVLTGTPIKNRLRDIFFLLHWVAADNQARFPYTDAPGQQERFAAEFNVCERNLSREAREREEKGQPKRTPKLTGKTAARGKPGVEVCNLHRLWKTIASLVLRRRMADIGEQIVAKRRQVIRAPLGKQQYEVYRYHLEGVYLDKNDKPAYAAQLQMLRSAAAAPNSELLEALPPECEAIPGGRYRSTLDYTPKLAAALNILAERMSLGEQTVVFSGLHEPLDTLSRRLEQARVPHDVLDGRKSAALRGRLSAAFQKGLPEANPVLLAGLKSMAEGNNWPLANNVIILAYDWAWDLMDQAIYRVLRLTSKRDVNIYPIICNGTIDRQLEELTNDKGDCADLVLDGKLMGEAAEEINLAELLEAAKVEFQGATIYDEQKLELDWPDLRDKLTLAWLSCQRQQPVKPAVITSVPLLVESLLR